MLLDNKFFAFTVHCGLQIFVWLFQGLQIYFLRIVLFCSTVLFDQRVSAAVFDYSVLKKYLLISQCSVLEHLSPLSDEKPFDNLK